VERGASSCLPQLKSGEEEEEGGLPLPVATRRSRGGGIRGAARRGAAGWNWERTARVSVGGVASGGI